jgi:hypothetical protein
MRRVAQAAIIGIVTVTTVVAIGQAAAANTTDTSSMDECLSAQAPNYTSAILVGPNNITPVQPPAGVFEHDTFRLSSPSQNYYVDYWGTTKNVIGELPAAPGHWPAPAERRYMTIARVNQGTVWLAARNRYYNANQWFPVGLGSGCMVYHGPNTGTRFYLSVNDTNIGDNSGIYGVTVEHWW